MPDERRGSISDAIPSLKVLSEVPYFDEDLAIKLLQKPGDREAASRREALSTVSLLVSYGGVERIKEVFRVPESVQAGILSNSERVSTAEQKRAANLFVSHSRSSMQEPLLRILGRRGRDLTIACYEVVARPDSLSTSNRLATLLFSARDYGRLTDLAAAHYALEGRLLKSHRVLGFIDALALWNGGHRKKSVRKLRAIAERPNIDQIHGMASHLIGVYETGGRHWKRSEVHLRQAVSTFAGLGDPLGLSRATSSFGMLRREQGVWTRNYDPIIESLALFTRAAEISSRIPEHQPIPQTQTLGRIEIGISRSYFALGFDAEALDAAHSAVWRLERFDSEALWARENLASLLNRLGRGSDASSLLTATLAKMPLGVEGQKASLAAIVELSSISDFVDFSNEAEELFSRGIELATVLGLNQDLARLRLARARAGLSQRHHGELVDRQALASAASDLKKANEVVEGLGRGARNLSWEIERQKVRLGLLVQAQKADGFEPGDIHDSHPSRGEPSIRASRSLDA